MMSGVQCPRYSVHFYRDDVYKLVKFKRPLFPHVSARREDRGEEVPAEKLSQAVSRARSVVYQLAFCNDWDFFFTGTIDPAKYNRYHLADFYKSLTQWIRDYRKKYRCDLKYLFIPELHEDGAWHIHGFVRGIPENRLCPFIPGLHPKHLVDGGFMNWPDYQKRFGFCSLDVPRNLEDISGYITKYVTKDLGRCVSEYGGHLYRCSIGLARAFPMGYVYQSYAALDIYLDYDGMFCSNGWVRDVDWSFWLKFIPVDGVLPDLEYPEELPVVMSNVEMEQFAIAGWCNGSTSGSALEDAGSTPAPATNEWSE